MERRDFIRNIGIGIGATFLPFGALNELLKESPTPPPIASDWEIEYSTKTIKYVGGNPEGGVSLMDLYNFLRDEWDEVEGKLPIECETPNKYVVKELNLTSKHHDAIVSFENVGLCM